MTVHASWCSLDNMSMDRELERAIDQQAQDTPPVASQSPTVDASPDTALVTPTRRNAAYKVIDEILAVDVIAQEVTLKQQVAVAGLVVDRSDPKTTHMDVEVTHSFTKIDLARVGGKAAPELEAGGQVTSIEAEVIESGVGDPPEGGGAT